jgi:hypothetical protein
MGQCKAPSEKTASVGSIFLGCCHHGLSEVTCQDHFTSPFVCAACILAIVPVPPLPSVADAFSYFRRAAESARPRLVRSRCDSLAHCRCGAPPRPLQPVWSLQDFRVACARRHRPPTADRGCRGQGTTPRMGSRIFQLAGTREPRSKFGNHNIFVSITTARSGQRSPSEVKGQPTHPRRTRQSSTSAVRRYRVPSYALGCT